MNRVLSYATSMSLLGALVSLVALVVVLVEAMR